MKIEEIRADRLDSGGTTVADRQARRQVDAVVERASDDRARAALPRHRQLRADVRVPRGRPARLPDRQAPRSARRRGDQRAWRPRKACAPIEVKTHTTNMMEIPDEVKPILEQATFVVSSWFCSAWHPYCIDLRRRLGQRWVKITFFRNLDLLHTRAGALPDRARRRARPRDRRAHSAQHATTCCRSPTAAEATSRSR